MINKESHVQIDMQPKRRSKHKRLWLIVGVIGIILALFCVSLYIKSESRKIVIAIDPGHGGTDVGAQGIENEAVMNERTAKYLYELLKQDKRFKPVYTRKFKTDVKYTLAERIEKADKAKAQLMLSIHGNSSESKKGYGFESYAVPPGRNNHESSVKFAELIAERMASAGHKLRGENGVRYMYYVDAGSKGIKTDIREASYTNESRTEPSIAVVENPKCPSVLVEQSFVNHPGDYENWGSPEGNKKAATLYYEAICSYFELTTGL